MRRAVDGPQDRIATLHALLLGGCLGLGIVLALIGLLIGGCNTSVDERQLYEDAWDELHGEPRTGCSGVVPPDSGPFDKRVAFTFDDGPDSTDTPAVMAILESHGARGTFFVNGNKVHDDDDWRLLHDMVERGHLLANHTQTHPNAVSLDSEDFTAEVEQTHDILVQVLAEHGQTPKFFRFPYGSTNCDTYETVVDFGYQVVGWHVDTADWCFQSFTGGYGYCSASTFGSVPDEYRDDFVGLAVSQASWRSGGILLFHDIHSYTVENLDALLTRLEQEGYTFTTLDDVETFPQLNGVRLPWIGDVCETDEQCGFDDDGLDGYCHRFEDPVSRTEHGFCALPCDGYCPDLSGTAPTFCVASDDPHSGMCVSKSSSLNDYCDGIDGTEQREEERFVLYSGASASSAQVCVAPQE